MQSRDTAEPFPSAHPQGTTITVCGDVHGQYFDLLHIWDLNGIPSAENPYLFNGACSPVLRLEPRYS